MQLIYAGKTKRCHPQGVEFPSGFDVTHSLNHWSNKEPAIQYVREIIIPYVDKIKEELDLPKDQKSLLIYDVFNRQTTKRYTDFFLENDIVHVHVPASLAHKFQPLDINVNGVAKSFLKDKFQIWCTNEIQKQVDNGKGIFEVHVDTRLSRMKPILARWVIGFFGKLRNSEKKKKMIENGFKAAAITKALNSEKDFEEDLFSHLI